MVELFTFQFLQQDNNRDQYIQQLLLREIHFFLLIRITSNLNFLLERALTKFLKDRNLLLLTIFLLFILILDIILAYAYHLLVICEVTELL